MREIYAGDEVIWVSVDGPWPDAAGFRAVAARRASSRGELYRDGWQVTKAPLVAFTDSLTELGGGWRAAAVGALDGGASVVGGPVRPEATRTRRSTAGFLVEYGPHAVAPFTNAQGDVSANNVAYRREALAAVVVDGEPVWKTRVNQQLVDRGHAPVVVADMEVTSMKRYNTSDITVERAHHGRLYGAQRSAGWSRCRRVTAAAGCAAVPALAYGRLAARTSGDPQLRAGLMASTPLVVLALTAWSLGEATGYLSATESTRAVR